ncbi:MAG: hypothetical protein HY321_06870 [Armatimonadetes bacterium]|nr:hypothetical protein [Armatimonadota bacterium]
MSTLDPREVLLGELAAALEVPITLMVAGLGIVIVSTTVWAEESLRSLAPVVAFAIYPGPAAVATLSAMVVGGVVGIRCGLGFRDPFVASTIAATLTVGTEVLLAIAAASATGRVGIPPAIFHGGIYWREAWARFAVLPLPIAGSIYPHSFLGSCGVFLLANLLVAAVLWGLTVRAVRGASA